MVHVVYLVKPLHGPKAFLLRFSWCRKSMSKCRGKTLKGKSCKNVAIAGEAFCKFHRCYTSSKKNLEKLRLEVVKAQKLAAETSEFARTLHLKYIEAAKTT